MQGRIWSHEPAGIGGVKKTVTVGAEIELPFPPKRVLITDYNVVCEVKRRKITLQEDTNTTSP